MKQKFLMGNEAIGLGAVHAGVELVCGYPGTPSTEILETVEKINDTLQHKIFVEWSVNEKAAVEVAAGACMAGRRALVTMKQVGLNVAADPLLSLAYVGIKGGMVLAVADDPGPISSQTEQDTRTFASFCKIPVFDPSSPEEAYELVREAFRFSEEYGTPVLLRPTTRICHGCASVKVEDFADVERPQEGFVKDTAKWVIFPKTSYLNHARIERRNAELEGILSKRPYNRVVSVGQTGAPIAVAAGGISYEYVREAAELLRAEPGNGEISFEILKITTPFPFPADLAREFLEKHPKILTVEELDPVIERELVYLCGKYHIDSEIRGKITGDLPAAGENTVSEILKALRQLAGLPAKPEASETSALLPELPVRPPVLCAGCPHRGSFYAVKRAVKELGRSAVYSGDIGCYTLGNARPLDMVDTCLCMGAGVTMAQGLQIAEPDVLHFAFIGDSTFFASGIPGVINALYNRTDLILIVLDNATTAMTGHQPHPGTGVTMMGEASEKISIEKLLRAAGAERVITADPLRIREAADAVKEACAGTGVRAVIFRSPCIAKIRPAAPAEIRQDLCIKCKRCITELGCPAITAEPDRLQIDSALCTGCGLCTGVCPAGAIKTGGDAE